MIMKSLADLRTYAKDIKFIADTIESYPLGLDAMVDQLKQAVQRWSLPNFTGMDFGRGKDRTVKAIVKVSPAREVMSFIDANSKLPEGENKILSCLAQYPNGVTPKQLTVLTGYKRSTRDAYLRRLTKKGAIEKHGGRCFITDLGKQLVEFMPLPTGEELRAYWLQELPEGERAVFEIVIAAYPGDVNREEIDEQTGYKRSTRDAYIRRMLAKEIIIITAPGRIKASDHLFE